MFYFQSTVVSVKLQLHEFDALTPFPDNAVSMIFLLA